jgi:hypothetical protein
MGIRANKKTVLAEIQRVSDMSAEIAKRKPALGSVTHNASTAALCLGAVYALAWVLGEEATPSERIAKHNRSV